MLVNCLKMVSLASQVGFDGLADLLRIAGLGAILAAQQRVYIFDSSNRALWQGRCGRSVAFS
jgi:hypothetical protein